MYRASMIDALLQWANQKNIDLSDCSISTFSKEFKYDYDNKDEDGEPAKTLATRDTCALHLNFDMEKQSPESMRELKRAVGKPFEAKGQPQYGIRLEADLQWVLPTSGLDGWEEEPTIDVMEFNVHIVISGAYECTYTCKAKTPTEASLTAILTDGKIPRDGFDQATWDEITS